MLMKLLNDIEACIRITKKIKKKNEEYPQEINAIWRSIVDVKTKALRLDKPKSSEQRFPPSFSYKKPKLYYLEIYWELLIFQIIMIVLIVVYINKII